VTGLKRGLADSGKLLATGTISLFEIIATSQHKLNLVLASGSHPRGTLVIGVNYIERNSALLATNANPMPRPIPPFSIEQSAAEWSRFLRIMAWFV